MADQIPIPDVSQLPDQSAPNQYALQNANAAMAPPVQPPGGEPPFVQDTQGATMAQGPSSSPDPTANPSAIKSLLTNFFQGFGNAAMKHAGLPTPEETAVRQQQMKIQQQNADSMEGLRQAQQQANEFTPVQMPDGSTVQVRHADVPKILVAQTNAAARANQGLSQITPAMVQAIPELQGLEGQSVPKPVLDLITRRTVANIQGQNQAKRPSAAVRDDRFIKLQGQDPRTWTADDQQFIKGYSKFVDVNKVQPGLQRAQVMAAPRWAALDPERQAQIALAKGIATGPLANQLSSFNAFVGHLGDFHDAAQELKNSDYKLYNTAINRIALETGDQKIQGIIAKIEPVRKEFESLLLNNRALYEADRKSADVILNPASSPAQLEVAVKSLAGTAAIRLGAVNQNVKRITQTDIPELLEPANGAILEELGAQIPGYTGNGPDFSQTFKSPQGPANRARGGGSPSSVKIPPGAPPAPAQDGKLLKFAGKVIAKSQGGKWVAP